MTLCSQPIQINRYHVLKVLGLPAVLLGLGAAQAPAQDTAEFFGQNCVSCHTIGGGRLTGPDLKNVSQRKERDWLIRFLQSPQGMIDSGDPYALKLQQEARGVVMPTVNGMNAARAAGLVGLIEAESKLEKSHFAGMQISDRPFTSTDVALGKDTVLGLRPLANGGPSCMSCHTLRGLAPLGGGRLGPDLTRAYERLGGRKNLAAWLFAPATPTMQSIFKTHALKPEEILPLVAYLEYTARQGGQDDGVATLNFFLLALGGTVLGLVAFDGAWKKRFRAVRRPLVAGKRERGQR
jgi:mono/diheme cytochrome c family protein